MRNNCPIGLSSSSQLILFIGGGVALLAYVTFILVPAWLSYGRLWERVAASALTLFMLATLVVAGVVLGVAFVWSVKALG